jgi:NADPH:quinone reductase-like Zn-dependent oxidoreductase
MKAVIYTQYGAPDVLQLTELDKPTPGDQEILVKVQATTVTSGVVWARAGRHPDSPLFTLAVRIIFGLTKPKRTILGYELSGTVEAVGREVKRFKAGDRVFGTTSGLEAGAYAQYVCLPEDWQAGVIASMPAAMSFEEAAALPIGGMTASYLLRKGNLLPGQKVLVYGASGSVGTFSVQIAKNYYGAEVTGVCSASNHELVRSLGADQVIDYTRENFTLNGEMYDLIFDAVGKLAPSRCKGSLNQTGKFLSVKSPTCENLEDLLLLKELSAAGKIRSAIDRIYPLEQVAEAHKYVERGHKKGNVVITVGH